MGTSEGGCVIKEIKRKIDEETQRIAALQASFPPYDSSLGRWHENNRAYEIHSVELRDAYWAS